jgi:phosphoribosylformimino-5-aminoimidazole carboxamide ribonucleotide (ProFAR) isomerase
MEALIVDMEKDLEAMTKWLKDSDVKFNEDKTELHSMDCSPITLTSTKVQLHLYPK